MNEEKKTLMSSTNQTQQRKEHLIDRQTTNEEKNH